jgi:lipopolysaccharide transport system permease protein
MPSTQPLSHDSAKAPATPYRLVLEASDGPPKIDLAELWHYRDLLYFLTRREISIRYKQTLLGLAWAVLQPLLSMVVFSLFLGRLAGVNGDGLPYPVFSYLGLLPWTYFANAMTRSSASLVGNANLLSKVYFPRLLIPLSATLSALVDFAIAFVVLLGLMAWYRIPLSVSVLWLVPLTLATTFLATGIGMGLAALNVQYRDVQHAIPFLMQLWMFATPVVYPVDTLPERWRFLLDLNPMTGLIEAYRAAPLGRPIDLGSLAVSAAVGLVLVAIGVWRFRRMEKIFADVV